MSFKVNEVVTVVAVSGEYVGKFVEQSDNTITLKDPRMLIAGEQGVGFARGICMTSTENPNTMLFNQYVYVTETNEDFSKAYTQAISGIIL